jgi:hypothetical protein
MYRSFILGLVLSFGVMCAAGLWLTRSNGNPHATAEVPQLMEAAQARDGRPPDSFATQPALARLAVPALDARLTTPQRGDFSVPAAPAALPEGELPRKAVQAAVEGVTRCFRETRRRFPPPQQAVLKFTIKREGETGQLENGEVVESSISDPWVRTCLSGAMSDVRFPMSEGEGPVTVTWPFRLEQG